MSKYNYHRYVRNYLNSTVSLSMSSEDSGDTCTVFEHESDPETLKVIRSDSKEFTDYDEAERDFLRRVKQHINI